MDVLVVAGEASGDLHGADLLAALKRLRPDVRAFGMGGDRLAAEGLELVHHVRELSVMGVAEVVPKIPKILGLLRDLARVAAERRPVCAVLVDSPDFNLRLAKRLKALGIPVVAFVSPTVWAWREGRTKTIAARVDRMLCILPFEEAFLRERGVNAVYVGNPVVDQVPPQAPPAAFRAALGLAPDRPVLGLLPGSRRAELERLLPLMIESARTFAATHPDLQVVVPVAPTLPRQEIADAFTKAGLPVQLIAGRAAEVVGASNAAVVASGTATLEAALMGRPFVVVYRVSPLTYVVGRALVKIAFFSLPNLLAGRAVVPELLQSDATPARVVAELERMWPGAAGHAEVVAGLAQVRATLGPGGAAERAAAEVAAVIAACSR